MINMNIIFKYIVQNIKILITFSAIIYYDIFFI